MRSRMGLFISRDHDDMIKTTTIKSPGKIWVAGLVACILFTVLVYLPGMTGPFLFDDKPNIISNAPLLIENLSMDSLREAALSSNSGPLKRPVSMLSFALNHYASGLDPFFFKITNLAIHALNGILIFFLIHLLLKRLATKQVETTLNDKQAGIIALAITAAWLLHPLSLTSVLYTVQRMNSLSALFTVAGLLLYSIGRSRMLDKGTGHFAIIAAIAFCLPLAVLSKENGVLLPLYMLIIELIFFQFKTNTRPSRVLLTAIYAVLLLAPVIMATAYLINNPGWIADRYDARPFSLEERILTQTRALWYYITLIIVPDNDRLALFHDDFMISKSFFDPVTTIISTTGIAIVILLLPTIIKRAPILAFGILFFFSGHALESTILPLEMVHEHRNYLPMLGILTPVFFYLLHPKMLQKLPKIKFAVTAGIIVYLSITTVARASYWSDFTILSVHEAHSHPYSARANASAGDAYSRLCLASKNSSKEDFCNKAMRYYETSTELKSNYTYGLIEQIKLSERTGRAPDRQWLDELARRLRNEPFHVNSVAGIGSLISCQKQQQCKLPEGIIVELLRSSLENPTLRGRIRAEMLTLSSKYFIEQLKDPETALTLLAQASHAQPEDARYHLHLAKLLTLLGRNDDATQELNEASKLDILNRYNSEIESQRKAVSQ